jgi:hypothetical protein
LAFAIKPKETDPFAGIVIVAVALVKNDALTLAVAGVITVPIANAENDALSVQVPETVVTVVG